jgi:ATP-dependent exoDNAse (exonuclease V) beta subunit
LYFAEKNTFLQQPSTFQVYNASAGSGKTFTLVKEYLKVLLTSENIFSFQKVLAITFTNKAAGEMKERVLSSLEDFANGKENELFNIIVQEIAVDKKTIQERSKKILTAILQNYSAFSITTIDSFTHKIIKNFAFDLGLSLNFEIAMDAVSLLNEAVDVLISKIGTDKKLTKLLIDYSLEKTDDDKSWDISRDLNDFAKILLNEDDVLHFRNLADKQLNDFTRLKTKLSEEQTNIDKLQKEIGKLGLTIIDEVHLQHKDFYYSLIPKHFLSLSTNSKKTKFFEENTLKERIQENVFYSNNKSEEIKSTIESILPRLLDLYSKSELLFKQYTLNKLALKSILPLAVLNNINSELEEIKDDNNIRLNAEFNQLISDRIKDQPAPFIYERIGQRFQHYFIDEMQDTSVLQWENLIPLIDNALAQENSNLLIVGDGKQAIYRWRGGKAEQFINLGSQKQSPFHIDKQIKNLATNYRSYSEIINFNNSFFQHAASFLQNESYKNLFIEGNKQLENDKKGGFVSLSFLEKEGEKALDNLKYPKKVLEKIQHLQACFSLGEMCILTRTRKDGVAIASYLSENGIDIISSEILLLQNSAKVIFIINLLRVLQNPSDEETRFEILYFLYQHLQVKSSKTFFFTAFSKTDLKIVIASLREYHVSFELAKFYQLPFYEKIEEIIRGFNLVTSSDAYVQFFLDIVLEHQRNGKEIGEFLVFWEQKKEQLSIVAPKSANAIQIMTIHKSKGLEFPVVIFPCDVDVYRQIKPKSWLDTLPSTYEGFGELLVDYNKKLRIVSERGLTVYTQQREALELDNFNLLYVALTRAEEQLHIITEKKITSKGDENVHFYSGIFIHYLKQQNLWKETILEYSFGEDTRVCKKNDKASIAQIHEKFISTPWQAHNIVLLAGASKLWDTAQGKAIDFGNLFHEIFAQITTKDDIENVLVHYHQQGILDDEQTDFIRQRISSVVNHPMLATYYSDDVTVFNEREIIDADKQVMIPDRLVFIKEKKVVIIDYKTGTPSLEHHQQLLKYERVFHSMDVTVDKKLLIYLNDEIAVISV